MSRIVAFTYGSEPREIIGNIEKTAFLPPGKADRFAGYAVIGLPFRSGHVLALRRFPASSLGPGYTSVWHRSPAGIWTFYSTVPPEQGCSRYFGKEIRSYFRASPRIAKASWTGPNRRRTGPRLAACRDLRAVYRHWAFTIPKPSSASAKNPGA